MVWARLRALPCLGVALVLWASDARADECDPASGLSTCIDADVLWPHAGAGPFFSLGATSTTPEGRFAFGLVGSYLSRPVGLRVGSPDPEGTVVYAVDNVFDATFTFALGVTDRLELSIAAPVAFYQDGAGLTDATGSDTPLPRSAVRDMRFGLGATVLARPRTGEPSGFGLAARLEMAVPSGNDTAFAGDRAAVFVPSVVADWRRGRFGASLEGSARLRRETSLAGARVGSQLGGAIGATFDVLPERWLSAGAEAFALYTLASQAPPNRLQGQFDVGPALVPAEWLVSATTAHWLGGDIAFSLGGGGPIPLADQSPVTSPRFRLDLAVRYAPSAHDRDGDGVLDRDDKCPDEPEDKDGFQDDDGCPDPDNDGDRIPDTRDRCRDAAETVDGYRDDDGCPDDDDDADGVPDATDKCRNEAEDRDGFQDDDGCPDPDNDGDGIPDGQDRCPNGAEDKDGFRDEDGCPDPDDDLDGIPDAQDACPREPEDRDGFQDDDGCPDPDNDLDGVPDAADKCPREPETIDGKDDGDGCPEAGARSLVSVQSGRVELPTLERFQAGSAALSAGLEKQARMVAQAVRGQAPFEQVVVEAYADKAGDSSARGQELAVKRAEAVRRILVESGIPGDKVVAVVGDPGSRKGSLPAFDVTVVRARRPADTKPTKRAP